MRFYLITFALTWILVQGASSLFDSEDKALRNWQQQFLATQAREDADRAMTAQQQLAEHQKIWAEELAGAMGGIAAMNAKDPSLNIMQMLRQTGTACAPTNSSITVKVDRFTEFDVAMVLPEALPLTRLAEISQNYLKHTVPYVHSLRFIQGDKVLGELDNAAIESVADWNTVSVAAVEKLLLEADALDQPAVAESANAAPAEEDITPDQAKIKEAEAAFVERGGEHLKVINELVAQLNRAARLDSIQDATLFESQKAWLDQAAAQLTAERKYFLDRSSDFAALLNSRGLDPLVVRILKRDVAEKERADAGMYENVFGALSGYVQQIKTFLVKMDGLRNSWSLMPGSDQIQFSDTAAQSAYREGSEKVRAAAGGVTQAFEAWKDSQRGK